MYCLLKSIILGKRVKTNLHETIHRKYPKQVKYKDGVSEAIIMKLLGEKDWFGNMVSYNVDCDKCYTTLDTQNS